MPALNHDQQKVFIDLLSFINDPVRKTHRISGGAGTGKSFLISEVADNLLKHKDQDCPLKDVVITATTNKAAAVLKGTMPRHRADIKTIYSFMNLRVQNDFSNGTQKIVPTPKFVTHHNTLIIIDEASMVTKKLYHYLDVGTSSTCKILFVGDKNQLSPVKESISPVYSTDMSESFLNTSVRNAGQQALMDLCQQAKDTVLTGKFFKVQEVPGVIDLLSGPQLQGVLEQNFHQEDSSKRVLAYRNSRVMEYNNFIRKIKGYTESYTVGEILVNNDAAEIGDKLRLYTDQVVQVLERDKPYVDTDTVPGYDLGMVRLLVEDPETMIQYSVNVCEDPDDRADVLNHWRKQKKWDRYFKFKESTPDLRSISASTTHKAQGSTYDSVIVDLSDIGRSTNEAETARLLYVALSRPRSRLYIRGQLPERYLK